jgi:hypothetical protein
MMGLNLRGAQKGSGILPMNGWKKTSWIRNITPRWSPPSTMAHGRTTYPMKISKWARGLQVVGLTPGPHNSMQMD